MVIIRNLFRWIVGATFLFSGFVKVIDPLGYGYKIADYLEAMNLSAIDGAALPLAIALSVLELVIGFSLFFNQLPKLGALGALLMMVFFTPLTLWLAIANPVSDCGCFTLQQNGSATYLTGLTEKGIEQEELVVPAGAEVFCCLNEANARTVAFLCLSSTSVLTISVQTLPREWLFPKMHQNLWSRAFSFMRRMASRKNSLSTICPIQHGSSLMQNTI